MAKSKAIEKPSANNPSKFNKAKSSPKFQGRNRKKNKDIIQGKGESSRNEHGDAINLNLSENNVYKKEGNEKGQEIQKNQERFVESNKGQKNQKSGERHGVLVYKRSRDQKNQGKLDEKEKNGRDEKRKEKLGGMIFMCSAKTKPDCFLYRVMGVTVNKKELILGVKPGLKLFLYDFDLKLMYGIYEASSAGGVKLEPKAFGGSFPCQVRFVVHKDCFPITESVFKKAIKENYEKNKFKTELTVRQVLKLSALFHPVIGPSRSPPMVTVRDRVVYAGARDLQFCSDREAFARSNHDARRFSMLSDEKDRHAGYQQVGSSTHRDEFPCDLFMSEKEYRTYGLSGERRNLTPSHHTPSTLEPYQRDQEREHLLRQPDPIYSDTVPLQREAFRADPLYLNQPYCSSARRYSMLSDEKDRHAEYQQVGSTHRDEFPCDLFMSEKEYRTYGLSGERRNLTPSHHIPSTLDPYQRDQEREHLLRQPGPIYSETVPLQREAVRADPLYLNQPYYSSGRRELPSAITSRPVTASGSALAGLCPYIRDPYYTYHYGASSADAYVPTPMRDELSSGSYYVDGSRETCLYEADPLRRREADQVGRLYSTHASDALSNHNKLLQYDRAKPETAPPSVSSRYSFAGPSVSYR